MRTTPLALLLVSLVPLAAIACEAPALERSEGREDRASSVINGTASNDPADEAVVLLPIAGSFCTGTLIAPNLVLTARHCVSEPGAGQEECSAFGADKAPSTIGVALGAQPSAAATVAKGTRLFVEPNATICGQDIALVLLDKPVPNITPRQVRLTPPVVGELTTAVGYGQDENQAITGRKIRTGIAVQAIGPATRTATVGGQTASVNVPANDFMTGESVCHGDSGGPLFDAKGQVLGTTSRGTPLGCVGAPAIFSSNAAHAALIKTALAAAGHPLQPSTDAGTEAGADAGADAATPVTPATDAGAATDAGVVVTPVDAGPAAPDQVGSPSSNEESGEATEDKDDPSDVSEDEDEDETSSKPKTKPKSDSASDDTQPNTNAYGCSTMSSRSRSLAAMIPFVFALGALATRRRRRR